MFHKTSLRLTGLYLAILMVISLAFSTALYSLAMREVTGGLRRQNQVIEDRLPPDTYLPPSLERLLNQRRNEVIIEARNRILSELFLANVAILFLGGGISYVLARKTIEPIEQAHQSLEQFTADASHELRTPIAAMKSEIEIALLQPKLKMSEVRGLLSSNLEELDKLTLLTEGLLQIARLEELPLNIISQPLQPLIEAAVKNVLPEAKKKEITINQILSDSPDTVIADSHSLVEVLVILLDNSIKYSAKSADVEVSIGSKKDQTIIQVIDHGMGIKAEDLPHVFKRFYRADASRSETNGHGLGLAIASRLVEAQNGTLTLSSVPSKITTATIVLPR